MNTQAGNVSTQVLNAPWTPSRTFNQSDVKRAFNRPRERARLGRRQPAPSPAGSAVLESFWRRIAADTEDSPGGTPAPAAGTPALPRAVAARRNRPDVRRKFCARNQFGQ